MTNNGREKTQITNIRNEGRKITVNFTLIKGSRFYGQLNIYKLRDLHEMNIVLGKCNLPEMTQDERKNQITLYLVQRLNSLLNISETKEEKNNSRSRFF